MNLGDIKKDKPTIIEPAYNPGYTDYSAMNTNMNPFCFSMFNQMMNMGGMPFQTGFPFPYMMGQQPVPMKPHHGHSNKKALNVPMLSLDSYKDVKQIKEKFECLQNLNDPKFKVDHIKDADFFIIRSSNDDDLHKVVFHYIGCEVRYVVQLSEEQSHVARRIPQWSKKRS